MAEKRLWLVRGSHKVVEGDDDEPVNGSGLVPLPALLLCDPLRTVPLRSRGPLRALGHLCCI